MSTDDLTLCSKQSAGLEPLSSARNQIRIFVPTFVHKHIRVYHFNSASTFLQYLFAILVDFTGAEISLENTICTF